MELSKYDIQYVPRGIIKSQALANFLAEFIFRIDDEMVPIGWWYLESKGGQLWNNLRRSWQHIDQTGTKVWIQS